MTADQSIIDAIRDSGYVGDGDVITDAIVVFSHVTPEDEDCTGYGQVFLHGSMPHHTAIGLLEVAKRQLIEEAYGE